MDEKRARELIQAIVSHAVHIAIVRHDLVKADDEELDADEIVADTTRVLSGDDCGCLDPDDPDDLLKINATLNKVTAYAASEVAEATRELKAKAHICLWSKCVEPLHTRAELAESALATEQARSQKYKAWANCGGVDAGKVCDSEEEQGHKIFGPFVSEGEKTFCEFHWLKQSLAQEQARVRELTEAVTEAQRVIIILRNFNQKNSIGDTLNEFVAAIDAALKR